MALILAPYGGGTLIGSIGSTTFQRGRYGNLARQRVSPVDPNTLRQVNTRAALGYLSSRWGTDLTEAQRVGWNAYAQQTPWLPSIKFITGQNAYIAVNFIPVYVIGPGSETDDAPVTPLMGEHNLLGISAQAGDGNLVLNTINPALPVGDTFLLEISILQGPGKNFFKGPFAFQTSFDDTAVLPLLLHDFGASVPAGTKCWVKSRKWSAAQNKVSPRVITPFIFT